MEETLEKQILPSEEKDSDQGGIRLRLRDRDLLKKRKAEAEEKTTYRAQSIKRVKKRSSGAPGRKGRPRKEACVDVPEDQAQETDAVSVTEPALPTIAEPLTASENPLEGFLIEHLGPEEEKSLVTDAGDVPEQSQSSRNPAAPAQPDDPTLFSTEEWV